MASNVCSTRLAPTELAWLVICRRGISCISLLLVLMGMNPIFLGDRSDI
jgi:hypothetical protein